MAFNPPKTATGFTLPSLSTPVTSTAAPTGFTFGGGGPAGDASKNLFANTPNKTLFGATKPTVASPAPATPALSFGGLSGIAKTPSLSLGAATTSAATPKFGLGVTSTAASSFAPILASTTSSTSLSSGLTLGPSATSTASVAPKLTFPVVSSGVATTTSSTTTSSSSLLTGLIAPQTTITSSLTTTSLAATTTTTTIAPTTTTTTSMTFAQLEDSINKWTIDLEEQGKYFINQAKQLNAWDTLLISNGEKILNLNGSIERVKQQQTQLDQELDFVLAQQRELEELIVPLEKELMDKPVTDPERNRMYQYSEIIDSQLKQMSEDLKEIIEHINESHKDDEANHPIAQVGRILNAHMNSLQWIDQNTDQISKHLEQLSKLQDSNRRNFPLN